jgi:tetratricopeptide (TPR) repeat protein
MSTPQADGVVHILGAGLHGAGLHGADLRGDDANPLSLESLHDPTTGEWLAPPRLDGEAVAGLPEGATAPLFAVVDTGVDASHPWIARTLFDSVDLTGEGAEDRNGHGTWVALIALCGLAMPIGLLSIKALRNDGTGTPDALARGIRIAVRRGAATLNISAGVDQPDCHGDCSLCTAALDAAKQGVRVFTAAGNTTGVTMCPAKAGVVHPESGIVAVAMIDSSLGIDTANGTVYGAARMLPAVPVSVPDGPQAQRARAQIVENAAQAAFDGDELDQARALFESVVSANLQSGDSVVHRSTAHSMLQLGVIAVRQGRTQDALNVGANLIHTFDGDDDPTVHELVTVARQKRATLLRESGDLDAAIEEYTAIVADARPVGRFAAWPYQAWGLSQRGIARYEQQHTDDADADLAALTRLRRDAADHLSAEELTMLDGLIAETAAARVRATGVSDGP